MYGVNMRNKKNICALLILMMMGAITVAGNAVYANDEAVSAEVAEQKEIKGNKDALETAQDLINNKNFQGALTYLEAYISSKPKKYEGYKLRGDAYYALRRYDLAEKDYQTAVDLKAEDDKFITNTKVITAAVLGADKNDQRQNPELGNLYAKLMYAQKAQNNPAYEVSYAKAVEFNSHIYLPQPKKDDITQINCPQKYGKVFNPQGDDKFLYGAIEDIEKENFRDSIFKSQYIISAYPDYYMGYYLNGVALAGLEQDEDAILAFKKSLEKNSYDFEALAGIGQIYYSRAEKTFSVSDAKNSIEYFKKAIKLNPNCNSYYFYNGLNELQLGNINSSIENFNSAIKLKPNDYNSLYYKLIAQYIKGDYSDVIEGSTNLLYKHVSNYNSVLYLRALAQYKSESYDLALEDLGKIYNNTHDIYNEDIRYVSPKEKTLESYVYYLKAQILNKKGQGTKSDIARAYQNPIIAKLAGVEQVLKPYEKAMRGDTVTVEDYEKFLNAYRAVPSLLQANLRITEDDIENQYDYIRTTFDDLGVSFVYNNPYYQMIAIDDYAAKKYSLKLSGENVEKIVANKELELRQREENVPVLKAHTPQSEMIANENSTSIAQMLASQSLLTEVKSTSEKQVAKDNVIVSVQTKSEEVLISPPKTEEKMVEEVLPSDKTICENSEVAEIVPPNIETPEEKVVENSAPLEETIELPTVENVQETLISKESKEDEEKPVQITEDIQAKQPEPQVQASEEAKPESKINEKHAKVNPEEFSVASSKPLPVIENPEDVVELEPQSFMFKAPHQMPVESFEIKYPTKITEDFSGLKTAKEEKLPVIESVKSSDEDERIILPETDDEKVSNQKDESVAVPIVLVPEIGTPVVKNNEKVNAVMPDLELRPSEDVESVANANDTEVSPAEKPAKAAKVKKQKVKKQKTENEKPIKVKKEKPVKEQAEKPIREKKVKVKEVKPVKEEKLTESEQTIHSIVAETFGAAENETVETPGVTVETSEKPAKEVLEKPVKVKKEKPVKEIKPKKEKLEQPQISEETEAAPPVEEVKVNTTESSEIINSEGSKKKKKKKKFHWWLRKNKVEDKIDQTEIIE